MKRHEYKLKMTTDSPMMATRVIKLMSADGVEFSVPYDSIKLSTTVKNLVEDINGEDNVIPIPNVTGEILSKVIDFCNHRANNPESRPFDYVKTKDELKITYSWDVDFCKCELSTIFSIVNAANFLDVAPLLNLMFTYLALMIKGKSVEEIRTIFNIKADD